VSAIAKANPHTVVVMSVPGAVLTPWAAEVAAIVTNFMPGQAAGDAIADIVFGKVNPSARLPVTFPNKENEQDFTPAQWPGLPDPEAPLYANYSEGLLVGCELQPGSRARGAQPRAHTWCVNHGGTDVCHLLQTVTTTPTISSPPSHS
jgi:hypothetical protein